MNSPEWILVGLGNPGPKYTNTRHNAGFVCIDLLADKHHIRVDKGKFNALVGDGEINGHRCLLVKPQTYMNRSGLAVKACADFYHIDPDHLLVLMDDISFSPGSLRIRKDGSAGGHNGMKSIIEHLASQQFPRIKLGVGQKPESWDLADWVLSNFNAEEKASLKEAAENAVLAVEMIVNGQIEQAMSKLNRLS